MWNYEKRLQFPVNIKNPNAKIAQIIISQYGGPDGEMGASMRYLSQRYATPYRDVAEERHCKDYCKRERKKTFHCISIYYQVQTKCGLLPPRLGAKLGTGLIGYDKQPTPEVQVVCNRISNSHV